MEASIEQTQVAPYKIKELHSRQKEILRLLATGLYNIQEVAEITGVSPRTVYNIANTALGKQTIEMLNGVADSETIDLMVQIRNLAPIALAVQQGFMLDEGAPIGVRNKIADKLLDRAGYSPVNKNLNMNYGLSREELQAVKERAEELRRQVGDIEDAKVVEETNAN
jgi:DNA-binding CsgD family transcriptional regulator